MLDNEVLFKMSRSVLYAIRSQGDGTNNCEQKGKKKKKSQMVRLFDKVIPLESYLEVFSFFFSFTWSVRDIDLPLQCCDCLMTGNMT